MSLVKLRKSTLRGAAAAVAAAAFAGSVSAQTPNITVPDANVLVLLEPFLNLPNTAAGQQTLSLNLSQAILTNNQATTSVISTVTGNPVVESTSISDKTIFSGTSTSITLAATTTSSNGYIIASSYGPGANLGGGLPQQAIQNGVNSQNQPTNGTVTPYQPYGAFGQLGGAYQQYVAPGQSNGVITLLTSAYNNLTSPALGIAKYYFANDTTSGTTHVVSPSGYNLPTVQGGANSTYDKFYLSQGYTYNGLGANQYGDTRPGQFNAPAGQAGVIGYDPNALTNLTGNPAFPSGHTTYAYTDSILLGMLSPQYFQAFLLRASEYGNSRIDLGVHYPLDIIGSRSFVQYTLTQAFLAGPSSPYSYQNSISNGVQSTTPLTGTNGTGLTGAFTSAAPSFNAYLSNYASSNASTLGCASVAACSANNAYASYSSSTYSYEGSSNAAINQYRQTYGLPTLSFTAAPRELTDGTANTATGGASSNTAAILLATLYGGQNSVANALANAANGGTNGAGLLGNLSTATINQIIYNTEGQAFSAFYGTQLSYWSRINLYDAAGYFQNVTGTITLASTDAVNTAVTVSSTGVLGGNGTINNNVTFQSGGALGIQGNGAAGQTAYTGLTATSANFSAGSKVDVTGGAFLPGRTYTILTTTGGTGSLLVNNGATNGIVSPSNIVVDTSMSGNLMTLFTGQLAVAGDPVLTVTFTANFAAAATSPNQRAVANAIDAVANTGNFGNNGAAFLAGLIANNTVATAPAAFNSLGGEGLTGQQQTALNTGSLFVTTVIGQATYFADDRSNDIFGLKDGPVCSLKDGYDCAFASRARFWAAGFGEQASLTGQGATGSAGVTSNSGGVVAGVDYEVSRDLLLGLAGGYSSSYFSVPDRVTSGTLEGGHFAAYGRENFGAFYVAGAVEYAHYNNTTDRSVTGLGGVEEEKGRFSSDEWLARFEGGYKTRFDNVNVTPFVGFEVGSLYNGAFNEFSTGVAGLSVAGTTVDTDKSFVGVQFDTKLVSHEGLVVSPYLRLSWEHEFASTNRGLTASFESLPGANFAVLGASAANDVGRFDGGFKFNLTSDISLFADVQGLISDRGNSYAGTGGLKFRF